MSRKSYPRQIYLPPAGRPRWMPRDPKGWDLLYLSWGQRWFGESPIPPAMHDGWVYAVVLEGTPQLITENGVIRMHPGTVQIIHPDCAYGWTDEPKRACRVLTWLWRSMPALSALQPPKGAFLEIFPEPDVLKRLTKLHAGCVNEVAHPDEVAVLSLHRARLELDVTLARAQKHRPEVDPHYRMKLAMEFLRNNLCDRQPVQRLCEYLQLTPSALNALFREQTGENVKNFILRWRMKMACAKLRSEKLPVKQVAFELGYRHANDFSRAFKSYFGTTTRRWHKK